MTRPGWEPLAGTPMKHQWEDVDRQRVHSRIFVFNDLGTGKTAHTAWWLQCLWLNEIIDEVVVVGPSILFADWRSTMSGLAWPAELVEVVDARPPKAQRLADALLSPAIPHPGRIRVHFTTYGAIRSMFAAKADGSHELLRHVAGRRIALVVDEAHSVALSETAQSLAMYTLADRCAAVAAMTATPIGRLTHLRMYGLTRLVRPDILRSLPPDSVYGQHTPGTKVHFACRYAVLHDPVDDGKFNPYRAYPISVNQEMMKREVLARTAPFTVERRKDECLDLPPKVRTIRGVPMSAEVKRLMLELQEQDRAFLEDGRAVLVENALEERLRTVELSDGYLEGTPVHSLKLEALLEVIGEVVPPTVEQHGRCALLVWCSRTMSLLAAGLVVAGWKPDDALHAPARMDAREVARVCYENGVGIIHGPTPANQRDLIQAEWRSGKIKTVVAHPAVAGAGLNWPHVHHTIFYGQPIGGIARQQSEDRVHRRGLAHTAYYTDLILEGGPDETIARAHHEQRSAEDALLRWVGNSRRVG